VGRSAKSYREFGRKIQVHHNTVKKYLTKMEVDLTQNFFSAKSIYKCVDDELMDDESYFTVDGNEWQQQSYYESEDHPAIEDVKFIRKTKFPAKVLFWPDVTSAHYTKDTLVLRLCRSKD
jgi:hypothetical protein